MSGEAQAGLNSKTSPKMIQMRTLTTNRFLTKALRTLCCAGALTACSAWATVVTWQLSPGGSVGVTKDLPQSGYTNRAWEINNTPVTDASHQFLFKAAPESAAVSATSAGVAGTHTTEAWGVDNKPVTDAPHAFPFRTAPVSGAASETNAPVAGTLNNKQQASETSAGLAGTLNSKPQPSYIDFQQESQSTLSQSGGQISARNTRPDEASLFAASNTQAQSTAPTQPGGALASAFDEGFVSVPTVQFASTAPAASGTSGSAASNDPAPVPEMSALFPIVGLIAAVSCTQILRRRRAAQQSAPRSLA